MRSTLAAVFFLIGWGSVAQADILAGGAAYGGPTQYTGVCYLYNAGGGSVTVSSIHIYDEVGNAYITLSDSCTTILAGRTCRTVSRIFDGNAYSCKAVVSSKANVRGRLELRKSDGTYLTHQELR
jgi:hypothetical protein